MKRLSNGTLRIKPRSGQSADVDATATKSTAIAGELHFANDTGGLYYFDGTDMRPIAQGWSGTFTNADGATVTVSHGLITDVS